MSFYARTEPGQRDNELHSIIGTEVAPISPELEKYYSKYFSDRQKVVSLDVKYSDVFKQLKDSASELEKQITELLSSIKSRTSQYNSDSQTLNSDIDSFNTKANNGQLTLEQFNYERYVLQSRVTELEKTRNSINTDVQLYDNLVTEHNKIASESNKLFKSIDSTLAPAPSI
jgi:chromosome segregation ATPase